MKKININVMVTTIVISSVLAAPVVLAWTVSETVGEIPDLSLELPKEEEGSLMKIVPSVSASITQGAEPKPVVRAAAPVVGFDKKPTQLTEDEKTSADYRSAMAALNKGEENIAENLFLKNLATSIDHHASRVELAKLYLKRNRNDEAEILLEEGLRISENFPHFLRLMAVVYDRKNDSEKALSYLMKVPESKRQDTTYVALLAHAYQKTGQYALARQQYYRLLQNEPRNALWLLGVSIALESEGQREAALEGYQKLNHEGNMDPQVLNYVRDRIKALKG